MLEIVERCLCFCGSLEFVSLFHQLIERECLFAQLADEPTEYCDSDGRFLNLSKLGRRLHSQDGLNLFWVCFDASCKDKVPQELSGWHAKDTLLRVKLDFVAPKVGECFT